jgi:hypothetical protein
MPTETLKALLERITSGAEDIDAGEASPSELLLRMRTASRRPPYAAWRDIGPLPDGDLK